MSELLWNRAPSTPIATLVLAHGAGAPMDSPFMETMASLLAESGVNVVRFEFAYMARRREEDIKAPPDRAAKLLDCFQAVMDQVRREESTGPVWAGGKSMGGRMATMLAADPGPVPEGCVVFGYPFHPPGKLEKTRLDHFPALAVPVLICQGERDPFGKPREVADYDLPGSVTVHWIADGDHDLTPRKRSGIDPQANLARAARQAADFIRGRVSR
ncbi:MAG TPA: alpha/beta family hydrolase [Alcanivorax sp.]|nr:alpha/beta family hydrolase [Alcanivorax sp.]